MSVDAPAPVISVAEKTDLVQDVLTDCSVVASLCATTSRLERGLEKVCWQLPIYIYIFFAYINYDRTSFRYPILRMSRETRSNQCRENTSSAFTSTDVFER